MIAMDDAETYIKYEGEAGNEGGIMEYKMIIYHFIELIRKDLNP